MAPLLKKRVAGEEGQDFPLNTGGTLHLSVRQGQWYISLVLQISSFLCFLIRNPHTPLVFGVQGLITLNFFPCLSCLNLGGFSHTSVLPKGGVRRKWCCLWCNFNNRWSERVNGKGWRRARNHFFFFKWQRRVTFLVSGIIVFFINLKPDAAIYGLLFFPVALAKNFKVIPYWLSFPLCFTASGHSLNQISNKDRRLRACLFAETAGNLLIFQEATEDAGVSAVHRLNIQSNLGERLACFCW